MSSKYQTLPLSTSRPHAAKARTSRPRALLFVALVTVCVCAWLGVWQPRVDEHVWLAGVSDVCPQEPAYDVDKAFHGLDLRRPSIKKSTELLSEAVQIDTTVGDHWPDPDDQDEVWHAFPPFAKWLTKAYPYIHAKSSPLTREFVHKHGIVYTWEGTDPSLKPLMLTAHQDVVPVNEETADQWMFPPFSGHIDLENQTVWGRGAVDCKLWLIGIMSSVESLLESGFQPKRTILLAFGFDEESNGQQGAQHIAKFLEKKYGTFSVGMIVDEGQPVVSPADPGSYGMPFAAPSVSERGATDIRLTFHGVGGHSSMPPEHTTIGFMSLVVAYLEAHPFPDLLQDASRASVQQLQCMRDAPGMPSQLRKALVRLELAEAALLSDTSRLTAQMPRWQRLLESFTSKPSKLERLEQARSDVLDALDYTSKVLMKTTQAMDVIRGGVKVNALPEQTEVMINHRIAVYSSVAEVVDRYRRLLVPLAKEHGFGFQIEGEELVPTPPGSQNVLVVERINVSTDTHAPSPFEKEDEDAAAYRLLSSVIRATWKADQPRNVLKSLDDDSLPVQGTFTDSIRVGPSVMFGNTDTRWYLNLTQNIFRFGAMSIHPDMTGLSPLRHVHTVNEHASIDSIVKSTEFYSNLIVAMDTETIERV